MIAVIFSISADTVYKELCDNVCDRFGGDDVTALHVAVRHQLLSIASLLLSHGANVNCASHYDRRTPLQVAASTGNTDIIQLLVDNDAAVDQTDIYGSTALHLTVVNGRLDAGRVLMDCRSDVNAYDNDGWTALHLAAEMGHLPLLKLFIRNKAYVECQTKFGRTPLHWACCRGHIQVHSDQSRRPFGSAAPSVVEGMSQRVREF